MQNGQSKITFLGFKDFANVMTEWSRAINLYLPDLEAKSMCLLPHALNYTLKHDYDLASASNATCAEARNWLMDSKYIIMAESRSIIRNMVTQKLQLNIFNDTLAGTANKIYAWYAGSLYRQNYKSFNASDPATFSKRLMCLDLHFLSHQSSHDYPMFFSYIPPEEEDVYALINTKFRKKKLTILHCAPLNLYKKGTSTIRKVVNDLLHMEAFKGRFEYVDVIRRPHAEVMELKKEAHIYIDEFAPRVGGYGVSSVESAAYGSIVLATLTKVGPDQIKKAYESSSNPDLTLEIVPLGATIESFRDSLKALLNKSHEALRAQAIKTYEWYLATHAPQAVCSKFRKEIFCD